MTKRRILAATGVVAFVAMAAAIVAVECPADSQVDMAWERDCLGLSFADYAKQQPEMWLPKSEYVVLSMAVVEESNAIWVGTTDGLTICRMDGTPVRRLLQKVRAQGDSEDLSEVVRRAHGTITTIVPMAGGKVWVKALRGSYLLDADGKVIEDCQSDKQTVEKLHDWIVKDTRIREFFPVSENKVYLPLAGSRVGEYEGGEWEFIGDLPVDGSVRKVHIIGAELYAAGRGGLLRVQDGKPMLRSDVHVEAAKITDDTWLCAGGSIWLISSKDVTRVSDYPESQGLGVCSPGKGDVALSCYDSSRILIFRSNDKAVLPVELPKGHRWRGFVCPPAMGGKRSNETKPTTSPAESTEDIFILTSNGIVRSDMIGATEIVKFPVAQMSPPWREALARGIPANCAFIRDGEMFIGTGIGLAKYNLASKRLEWVWRAGR